MKKKILFVINTFSRAGAETALLNLLRELEERNSQMGHSQYEISLFVLMEQGELALQLPDGVNLLNRHYSVESVLEQAGKRHMIQTVLRAMLRRGTGLRLLGYLRRSYRKMLRDGQVRLDKLLWRVLSDGAPRLEENYDLAVAFLEGGSAYYVTDHVNAKKKAAFIHIDYEKAGYNRELDKDCYLNYDAIFPIGEQVQSQFLKVYPECRGKTTIFHNIINADQIHKMSKQEGGFSDGFDGTRLLTVGRLTEQKAYPVAIEAVELLKRSGVKVRWYVLGEGPEREHLERSIAQKGLEKDFVLLGAKDNPYPYFAQTDIYVHATGFEGKSIAIQEAQVLGCAIVASDTNWEQIEQGKDGILCELNAQSLAEAIRSLVENPSMREMLGQAAWHKSQYFEDDIALLEQLVTEENRE